VVEVGTMKSRDPQRLRALLLIAAGAQLACFQAAWSQTSAGSTPSSANQTVVVQSVSIFASPVAPDTGGHSVIGGLLTGKGLTAILPNLKVCAKSKDMSHAKQVCTRVCKPGHECLNQPFPFGLLRSPANPTLTVSVLDVDRPGSEHKVVPSRSVMYRK
jgi:hypothetical protein